MWHWGKLTTILNKGSFTNPSTCLVDVYIPDENSSKTPKPMIRSTDPTLNGISVVNRDSSIDAGSGAICKIEDDDRGEWSLKWISD